MTTLRTVDEARRALDRYRRDGNIGLVPTMGALHDGHMALLQAARKTCDPVVASIFVNPAQFNDPSDLAAYPRDEARDLSIAAEAGVDFVFAPQAAEIYAPGHATWVEPEGAALSFEGASRPGHFRGVATVCLKLFSIVQPRVVFFGQKDAQQVAVIRQMVRDLNLPLDVHVVPTVRDHDGLAFSSRNARLSPEERARARALPRALDRGLAAWRRGEDPVAAAGRELDGIDLDYLADAVLDGQRTLIVAARVGKTRLIDNVRLDASEAGLELAAAQKTAD